MKVKFSYKKPPHYFILKLIFGFDWERNIATLGDTIYVKIKTLPDHLVEHEKTHLKQQRYSKLYAVWWWIKYIVSKKFRYGQELEAYRNQWKCFILRGRSSQEKSLFMNKIAGDLSGKLYGNIVPYNIAVKEIMQ